MSSVVNFFEGIALYVLFIARFFAQLFRRPFEWLETGRQMYEIGAKSVLIVGVAGLAIGMVLAMQTSSTLARFGGQGLLPSMIAVAVLREIGPIITALVVSGRVGAGIGAELGAMRVTEQIDAMEVAALNPFHYLVVTRVLACMLMLPILTVYANFLALLGGFFVLRIEQNMSLKLYFDSALRFLNLRTVLPALGKTAVFGFIIGSMACYLGYNTSGGTTGVGRSAMIAVVLATVLTIVADVVLVKFTIMLFG
ncbi:ABC transporter permease [candidate division KSB1 bacterium]|nr:ABC transporter permease [candidate division KSB1 bacterium]